MPTKKKVTSKKKAAPKKQAPVKKTATSQQSAATSINDTLSNIEISLIAPDPNQPRKFFDENSMAELIDSVREKGVLQPVLVRPDGDGFLLVCGERRLKAATAAGMKQIPAVIRALTDQEALELQIVENLQRKNVHPMEEATAFKSLLDHKQFKVEEIAARVGKSGTYVALRIKLNDLVPDFQEMFFQNRMLLTDAIKISRTPLTVQEVILKEHCKNWRKDKNYMLERVAYFLTRNENNLSGAPFKITDPNLYPEAGACTTCPHNSASNPLLFPELENKKICSNSVCFEIKSSRAYQEKMKKVAEDPEIVFISDTSYLDDDDKMRVKAAEDLGINVIDSGRFEELREPEHPGTWEEYLKRSTSWADDDDDLDEEECRNEYDEEIDDYKAEKKEYEEAKASGRIRKAFVVTGDRSSRGKLVDIILKAKKLSAGENPQSTSDIDMQITALIDREKRNKELDREKVYKKAMDKLQAVININDDLHPAEWLALGLFVYEFGDYKTHEWLHKELGVSNNDWQKKKVFTAMASKTGHDLINQLIRRTLMGKLVTASELDPERYGKAEAMYRLAELWMPEDLKLLEIEQSEVSERRIERVNKRIAAFEKQKEELKGKKAEPEKKVPAAKKGATK